MTQSDVSRKHGVRGGHCPRKFLMLMVLSNLFTTNETFPRDDDGYADPENGTELISQEVIFEIRFLKQNFPYMREN